MTRVRRTSKRGRKKQNGLAKTARSKKSAPTVTTAQPDFTRCFGATASGTVRERERRAIVMASTQALIDLLNQP